jgi:hypothetical protein
VKWRGVGMGMGWVLQHWVAGYASGVQGFLGVTMGWKIRTIRNYTP